MERVNADLFEDKRWNVGEREERQEGLRERLKEVAPTDFITTAATSGQNYEQLSAG